MDKFPHTVLDEEADDTTDESRSKNTDLRKWCVEQALFLAKQHEQTMVDEVLESSEKIRLWVLKSD